MNINLNAPFYLIQKSVPHFKKNENSWGRIINISSVHGVVASINKSAYCSAKHGLNGLTKVTSLEYAQTGITCNSVCPGFVLTPLVMKQVETRAKEKNITIEEAKMDLVAEKQPTKRFTTSKQIADMCVFLSTDSASNMTGQSLLMDGAWTVW